MRLTWLIGILTLLAIGCSSGESTGQTLIPTPVPASDISKLEQLVTRLYTQPPGVSPNLGGAPQILVGKMPPNFSVRIPDGANIFGSVVQNYSSFQTVVDLPFNRSEGEAFLGEALVEAGWREQRCPDQPGFTTSSGFPLGYCNDGDVILYVFLSDSPVENFTEARIQSTKLDYLPPDFCGENRTSERLSSDETPDLPSLSSPEGVIALNTRNSGAVTRASARGLDGSASESITVTLETDLRAAALEEHYREQLEDLDWELLEQGAAGPLAVSTWRFTDEAGEDHLGLLWVVEGPGVDWRTAFLEVTRPGQ